MRTHETLRDHTQCFLLFPSHYIASVGLPHWTAFPLRPARRPNRGHIGGGGWTLSCGTCLDVFVASGFSTSTLVNSEVDASNASCIYYVAKSGEIASIFSRNEGDEKRDSIRRGARSHDLKLGKSTWTPTRPPGRSPRR